MKDYTYAEFEQFNFQFRSVLEFLVTYDDFPGSWKNFPLKERLKTYYATKWEISWHDLPNNKLIEATKNKIWPTTFPLVLYQCLSEPWVFVLRVEVGLFFPLLGMEPYGEFGWILFEDIQEKTTKDFKTFSEFFSPVLPETFRFVNITIEKTIALRMLYHAIFHPEQYLTTSLPRDFADKLIAHPMRDKRLVFSDYRLK